MYTVYKCQLVIQPARLLAQNCTSQSENLPSKFGCLRHLLTCQDCLPIIIMPSAHCNVWLFVHEGQRSTKPMPGSCKYLDPLLCVALAVRSQLTAHWWWFLMIFTYVVWFIPSFCTSWTNYRASTLRLRQAYRRQIKAFLNFRYSLPLTWRANGNWKIPNAPARGAGSALALVMSSSFWPLMFDIICKQSEHECTTCPNLT